MEALTLIATLKLLIGLVGIIVLVVASGVAMTYFERKVAGHVQRRPGPYEVGPHGLLQAIADVVKLLGKQFFIPSHADKPLFILAPIMAFFPVLALFLALPFGPLYPGGLMLVGLEVDLGLLLILSFSGLGVLSLMLAGWSSNNKYSLLGGARAVAQSVAYEIPLLLAVLALAFQHGTLNLSTLVDGQGSWPWQWNWLTQPLAFFIYVISAFGETNRTPFDLPEGESELTAGFHTEYSGMGFGLFFFAEYSNMLVVSAVATTLFLGGWKGPFIDGFWWFFLKTYAFMFFFLWVRWTFPRVRFDQLLNINWKWLIPLGLVNLWLTAVVIKLF